MGELGTVYRLLGNVTGVVYPAHWLIAFGGSLSADQEQWQCTLRMAGSGLSIPEADHVAANAEVATKVRTFFSSVGARASAASMKLAYCKFNRIAADGTYAEPVSHVFNYSPVVAGGTAASPPLPSQMALVISWLSNADRGDAHAGRMYWPAEAFTYSYGPPSGTTDALRDALANDAATLIRQLGTWTTITPSGAFAPVIVSRKGAGSTQGITRVRVGRRFDVQRRRAASLNESYETITV